MKHTRIIRLVSCILCVLLFAATAMTLMGCNDTDTEAAGFDIIASYDPDKPLARGAGDTVFYFSATDGTGATVYYEIHTNETTVGEALEKLGLIAGEEGTYGLYVNTVCDLTLDSDTDGAYWAFYEDGQYATAGVDKTAIRAGASYAFKAEKG